jgi:hypothetical protein
VSSILWCRRAGGVNTPSRLGQRSLLRVTFVQTCQQARVTHDDEYLIQPVLAQNSFRFTNSSVMCFAERRRRSQARTRQSCRLTPFRFFSTTVKKREILAANIQFAIGPSKKPTARRNTYILSYGREMHPMYCVEVTNLAPLPFDPRFKNARPPVHSTPRRHWADGTNHRPIFLPRSRW